MTDTPAIVLARGSHEPPAEDCADPQRCLMEWYNWLTRRQHTDQCPPGVSPVLHSFGISLNDGFGDDARQALTRFLPNGTDRLAGTAGDGRDETRGYMALDWLIRVYLPAWLDLAGLGADAGLLRDLPRLCTLGAARAAGPVVGASRDHAAAAWAAAWDAARAAAGDAAGDAAGAAARAAARDAAGDALAPTVAVLQGSAVELYARMIRGVWDE
jgi:hypothetical protein